jgi:hypothetical protein
MPEAKEILKLVSKGPKGEILREAHIDKTNGEYVLVEAKKPTTTHKTILDALKSPQLWGQWQGLEIQTNLKLYEIKELILTKWGPWGKIEGGKVKLGEAENAVVKINDKAYHRIINPRNFPTKESPGVTPDNDLHDKDCQLIKSLYTCSTNTKEQQWTKKHVIESLKKKGYITYIGDSRAFGGLSTIGMSVLYKVPLDKRGNLQQFRGRTIRICCIGSGDHAQREYIAGPIKQIQNSKENQIQTKEDLNPDAPKDSYCGFLSVLKPIENFPTELQLALENRSLSGVKKFTHQHKVSKENVLAIEKSNYCMQLSAEGELELLKELKNLGISMAVEKDYPPEGQPIPKNGYWHSLLWAVNDNCPSKLKEFLELYTQKEFKALINDEFINSSLSNIKSIILTERQRRLKKELENLSQHETLTI